MKDKSAINLSDAVSHSSHLNPTFFLTSANSIIVTMLFIGKSLYHPLLMGDGLHNLSSYETVYITP